MFQTEYNFELPKGYVDSNGNLHKKGTMRLATAADEIFPLKDPRVMQNQAYIAIIILSRVVVKLGSLTSVGTDVIENLFASDLYYLQGLYDEINKGEAASYEFSCPHCEKKTEIPLSFFLREQ